MSVDYTKLREALKIMNEAPASIQRAQNRYKDKIADIEAKSRDLSPNEKDGRKARAFEDRKIVVDRLMEQMDKAINIIDQNNSFDGESFDFSDPKFQSAINFMNMMGKDMTPVDQINLLNSFRGNAGALKALGSAMKKNGLYFASQANEMTKSIPHSALEDAGYVVSKYRYNGEIDLSRMTWSKGEFKKQAERLGYDITEGNDPYISALIDARNRISDSEDIKENIINKATKMRIDDAIREIQKAKTSGDNVEDVFSRAIRSIERMTGKTEAEGGATANAEG